MSLNAHRAVVLVTGAVLVGLFLGQSDRTADGAVPCAEWSCESLVEYAPNNNTTCFKHYVVQGGKNVARSYAVLSVWNSGNANNEDSPRIDQMTNIQRDIMTPTLWCSNNPPLYPQKADCGGDVTDTVAVNQYLCTKVDPGVRIVAPIVPYPGGE